MKIKRAANAAASAIQILMSTSKLDGGYYVLIPFCQEHNGNNFSPSSFVDCNFCRIHKSLRAMPALAAGISDEILDMSQIGRLIEEAEGPAKKRGPYKSKAA